MTTRTLPPQEYLRQCFEYDPETGVLAWKERPPSHFARGRDANAWNRRNAGKKAGVHDPDGYLVVGLKVEGRKVVWSAHRLIWKLVTGENAKEVDHRSRVTSDNSLDNLRPCTHAQNMCNGPMRKHNKCGFKGVYLAKGRWRSMIRVAGKSRHIGVFDTPEEAHAAYCLAANEMHGEFASYT